MEEKKSAKAIYTAELHKQKESLAVLRKSQSRIGWLRLIVVLATAIAAYHLFSISMLAGVSALVIGIAVFLFLISRDVTTSERIAHTKKLISVIEIELNVLDHQYFGLDDGMRFKPDEHPYANDLDIFGKASLYQYINRATTEQGQALLASNLLEGVIVNKAMERQAACKELQQQYEWRQQLQALSMQTTITHKTEQNLVHWLKQPDKHFTGGGWRFFLPVYAFITVGLAAATIAGFISLTIFTGFFILMLVFSSTLSSKALADYTQLNGAVKEAGTLMQVLKWIEQKPFATPYLQQLQQRVQVNGAQGHGQLKKLKDLLNRFDVRLNVLVFIVLNSFLLWDVWQMRALNKWRVSNRDKGTHWFELIAEMEVLNSLATLTFNQPEWVFPTFNDQHFHFKATAIGHPLLPAAQRVTSSFNLEGLGKVALITGSNMAGKSTFLRALGSNIILAQLGAPVCATSFLVSPVRIMSSMRIADNLAENTSTFYAELKKLKGIIEAVNRKEPVFVLLDEVLRGTNSLDRHIGSKALIEQLIRQQAVAVIATHDVDVAKLEEEYPGQLINYHFDVQVEGEELYFDYKLKNGVCTSLNASILMKKIGIELA